MHDDVRSRVCCYGSAFNSVHIESSSLGDLKQKQNMYVEHVCT